MTIANHRAKIELHACSTSTVDESRATPRTNSNKAEPHSGENIRVVGLVCHHRPAIPMDWRKRAAGANQGAALGPGHELLWRCLTAGSRIGERENDGPVHMFRHRADTVSVKAPGCVS